MILKGKKLIVSNIAQVKHVNKQLNNLNYIRLEKLLLIIKHVKKPQKLFNQIKVRQLTGSFNLCLDLYL